MSYPSSQRLGPRDTSNSHSVGGSNEAVYLQDKVHTLEATVRRLNTALLERTDELGRCRVLLYSTAEELADAVAAASKNEKKNNATADRSSSATREAGHGENDAELLSLMQRKIEVLKTQAVAAASSVCDDDIEAFVMRDDWGGKRRQTPSSSGGSISISKHNTVVAG